MQGANQFPEVNLYEANTLHQAQGRARLLLHYETAQVTRLEESTYLMPHSAEGQLLPARYARVITDSHCHLPTWVGRYAGALGQEASQLTVSPQPTTLTPAKNLVLNQEALVFPSVDDEKSILGEGAFAKVVRGTYYGQPVAVKLFNQSRLSAHDKAQLKDEAAVMANLHSPFLVSLWGLSADEQPMLVMELAQRNLYELLKDPSQTLSWSQRLRLLRDISLGLATVHAHDLVHRDLKSLNILLDADGRAKLCDFGLSTLKSQAKETRDVGTLLWNAPEVLQGKAATPASDMYSFAIIAWEMTTRRLPYCDPMTRKPTDSHWQSKVIAGYRESIPSDCPSELAIIIQTCWAQDSNQRPSTAQVAQILEGLWQTAVLSEPPRLESKLRQAETTTEPLLSISAKKLASTPLTNKENFPSLVTAQTPVPLFNAPPAIQTRSETKHTPTSESSSSLSSGIQPSLPDIPALAFQTLLTQSPTPCWQDKQSAHYTLGIKIQQLRHAVLTDPYLTQELSCYIAPNGQPQPGLPSDPLYPWVERELLQGPAQVLLLQGVAGAGKSTFNRHVLRSLWQDPAWQAYRPGDPAPRAPLPLWIPLASLQVNPAQLWDYCQLFTGDRGLDPSRNRRVATRLSTGLDRRRLR